MWRRWAINWGFIPMNAIAMRLTQVLDGISGQALIFSHFFSVKNLSTGRNLETRGIEDTKPQNQLSRVHRD